MIGAILYINDTLASKLMYHKFSGKAIIEHTIAAYLRSEQIQRVIVVLPQSERKYVSGNTIQSSLIAIGKIDNTKKLDFEFFIENTDIISFMHKVAVDYGLDHIVLGDLTAGLTPQWLINELVYTYFNTDTALTTYNNSEKSFAQYFEMCVFPFWKLARWTSHSEDRSPQIFRTLPLYENSGESNIIKCNHKMALYDLTQFDILDFMYSEMLSGTDINSIIEEVNDKQTHTIE